MKKKILALAVILLLAIGAIAWAEEAAPAPEAIRSEVSKVYVLEGKTLQIPITLEPENASRESLRYKVVTPGHFTIDDNGVITGIVDGTSNLVTFGVNAKGETIHNTITVVVQEPVTGIVLEDEDVILNVGKTRRISAKVTPSNASSRVLIYESTDESVVTVNSFGDMTAVKPGQAAIRITSELCPEHSVEVPVKVIGRVDRIKVTADKSRIGVGESIQLNVTAYPKESNPIACTYESNNPSIASVDENGVVTGHKRGKVTIFVYTAEGRRCRDTLMITVNQQPHELLVAEEMTALVGKNIVPDYQFVPESTSDKSLVITSSDTKVARIYMGKIVPVKQGECEITFTSKKWPEVSAVMKLTVLQPVTRVKINDANPTIIVGENYTMDITVSPDDASNKELEYSTNKEDILSVAEDGTITGVGRGKATVYAKAKDGSGERDTLIVTVVQQPETIEVAAEDVAFVGHNKKLAYKVLPENTNDKSVTFTSGDPSIATVNEDGVIKPLKTGMVTITVASKEFPEVKAESTIEVRKYVETITMVEKTASVMVGESIDLSCIVGPEDATDKTIIWSSSNEKIAKIAQNGVEVAVSAANEDDTEISAATEDEAAAEEDNSAEKAVVEETMIDTTQCVVDGLYGGECIIYATAADGSGVVAKCKLTVIQPVTGVHLYFRGNRIGVGETKGITAVVEPSNATNKKVEWEIDNRRLASLEEDKIYTANITGKRWGTILVSAVTDDGGFYAEKEIKIGDFDYAVVTDNLSINQNHVPSFMLNNVSNMDIVKVDVMVLGYNLKDGLVLLGNDGNAQLTGTFKGNLPAGTRKAVEIDFPTLDKWNTQMEKIQACVTGYETADGEKHAIEKENWIWYESVTVDYQIYQQTGGASQPGYRPPVTEEGTGSGTTNPGL